MRRSGISLFLAGMILLMVVAVPVFADSISSVSPAVGYRGETMTVTITGVNFTTTQGDVVLMMSDENNITTTISSWDAATIVCTVKITSSRETGDWDVVVVKGLDDSEIVKTDGFSITDAMALTSISPTTGEPDDDVDFTLKGSGLDIVEGVYLYNEDYDNITGNIDDQDSDEITGTFDLTNADEDTYDVCVEDTYGYAECDLSFRVHKEEVGSLSVSSDPSGASIYVDGTARGTTPNTVDDLVAGSHKLVLQKSGYQEWGKIVTIGADDETEVDADMNAIVTAAPASVRTAEPTSAKTAQPTSARTTRASTLAVPTSWPDATATSPESPLDPALVICTACLAFVALRTH